MSISEVEFNMQKKSFNFRVYLYREKSNTERMITLPEHKKPYQKPEIVVHAPGSPAYNRFMKLLDEENQQAQRISESLSSLGENKPIHSEQEAPNV